MMLHLAVAERSTEPEFCWSSRPSTSFEAVITASPLPQVGAVIEHPAVAAVTLTGSAAQINAALAGLVYAPDPDFFGAASLTIVTSDGALVVGTARDGSGDDRAFLALEESLFVAAEGGEPDAQLEPFLVRIAALFEAARERVEQEYLPLYDDLKELFATIDKEYSKSLYDMQFALYVDNIVNRIDVQTEAYGKEENIPATLFAVYEKQKAALLELKAAHGAIVTPERLT